MAISSIKTLVEQFKEVTGVETNKAAEATVRTVIDLLGTTLVRDGVLSLPGFGTFRVNDTAEREGRNIQTGETVVYPASKRVAFKIASGLKAEVRGQ